MELRRKNGTYMAGLVSARIIDLDDTEHIIAVTRDITDRKVMEEKLHSMSITNELTGLYNRRGFFALVEQQKLLKEPTERRFSFSLM